MLLLKTGSDTLKQVIENSKHASHSIPKGIRRGDIILIAQTKHTLEKNQKSIQYLMCFDECYEDRNNESDALWGKHWKYIIKGYDLRPVEPFNIEEIQVSNINYGPIMTHRLLEKEDVAAVEKHLRNSK